MNRIFATKFPALALLLVMLLNPIIGMAGSLLLEKNVQEAPSMDTSVDMSNSCHDNASISSTALDDSTQKHSECCDAPCMCGQGGCHSPVAILGVTSNSFGTLSADFYSSVVNYLSPTLNSQTPPPII